MKDICDCLKNDFVGLKTLMIPMYIEEIQENNINGLVLSSCDLDELKQVNRFDDEKFLSRTFHLFRFFRWRLVIGFFSAIGFERNAMKNG